MADDSIVNQIFFEKYKSLKRLGQGSFGQVYQGINLKSHELMAIKLEVKEDNTNLLETEAYRLIYLKGEGVPKVFCYGNNKLYNILVIELLGKSLEDLFNTCGRKFSLKTVSILGLEMLKRIQYVHDKNHIHRDIKPDNFMMGVNQSENTLYIIDFGLAKKYRSSTKKGHIPFKNHKNITGTARYCSVNTHRGYEQSRRDDLESIGFVLMYFLRGSLPWQGIKCRQDEDHYQKIYEKKKATSTEELCRGFPNQFVQYFDYVKSLSFTADPDYDFLSGLFIQVINDYCAETTHDFDWNNRLKSNTSVELSSKNTANTSLALGNHNISQYSPNAQNNDSHLNQINDDLNNMSIFQKDFDNNNNQNEFEPSIFVEEQPDEKGSPVRGARNKSPIGKGEPKNNEKNQKTEAVIKKEQSKSAPKAVVEENNNNNNKQPQNPNQNNNPPQEDKKKQKGPACRCVIF